MQGLGQEHKVRKLWEQTFKASSSNTCESQFVKMISPQYPTIYFTARVVLIC